MRRLPIVVPVLLAGAMVAVGCGATKKPDAPPEVKPEQRLRMADSLLKAGRPVEALALVQKAIDDDPNNASLHSSYGQVAFMAGRNGEAEAAYKKALDLDPSMTEVYNDLGALYAKTGRTTEAEAAFKKVLADPVYPHPERAYFNLGFLYGSQARDDEAVKSLRKAVEIDPKYYQAHYELASILDRGGKLEEAVRLYEVAAPAFKNVGEYQYRLGFAYFRMKEYEKAREHLTRTVQISPGSESSAKASDLLKMIP